MKGAGVLFTIEVKDKDGTLMKGTFFKEQAEEFYDQIQEGRVYSIYGASVKAENKMSR